MPFKYYVVAIVTLTTFLSASAQIPKEYYYKNNGRSVSTRDSADYIRTVSRLDTTALLFSISEYYKSGNLKCKGTSKIATYNVWVGEYDEYYPSGNKRLVQNYKDGRLLGTSAEYYPNGLLYTLKEFIEPQTSGKNNIGPTEVHFLIKTCNDSSGRPCVKDGSGHYIGYYKGFKSIFEEGDVQNGQRNGQWVGRREKSDSILFKENYDNGVLTSGVGTDKKGNTYSYTAREVQPQYPGGEPAFSKLLQRHVKYPKTAKKNNIQGRVFLTFVIEKDGSLTDIKAVRAPSDELAAEGIRVLNLSPKWIPGYQYGQPVRVQYTIPLNFSLKDWF